MSDNARAIKAGLHCSPARWLGLHLAADLLKAVDSTAGTSQAWELD